MKGRRIAVFLCLSLLLACSVTARADTGPKPSVRITFTGLEGESYYGTLLSQRSSTGPASAWDGVSEYSHYSWGEEGRETWGKFVEYEDEDGYYFLQEWWHCSENGQLNWTYYPPTPFKILLYFPEQDLFCVSPICERYAFHSYFTADLSAYETGGMEVRTSYDCTWEVISLAARALLTIALELGIARLFGYRGRRVLAFLAVVNVVTQLGLNIALNFINYTSGPLMFALSYVLLELAVFAVEAVLYACLLQRYGGGYTRRRAVVYALCANAASFTVGLWLAHLIPGIF